MFGSILIAELYNENGKNRRAIEEIKALVEAKRDTKYLLVYAEILYSGGKYQDAEDAVKDVRLTYPEDMNAIMMLGKIKSAEGDDSAAIEVYKEAAYVDRNYTPAYYEMAEVYMKNSNPLRAELYYQRALSRDPGYALAELGLAKVAKIQKNKAKYLEHLEKAKRLDPNNQVIMVEVGNSQK